MNILVLAHQHVNPPSDGGKKAVYYPNKYLSKENTISFGYICDKSKYIECPKDNLYQEFNIKSYPFMLDVSDKPVSLICNIFQKSPFKWLKYWDVKFYKKLRNIVVNDEIDIIWCNHPHTVKYALLLKKEFNIPIILREHNIEFDLVKQYYTYEKNFIKKIIAYWQYKKTIATEIKYWKIVDHVFFISNSDLKKASEFYKFSNDNLLYEGIELEEINTNINVEEKSFVFTGSIKSSVQNKFIIDNFINNIWEQFIKEHNDYKLYLTGSTYTDLEKYLNFSKNILNKNNIFCLGFVDDIKTTIMSKKYFLSPTIFGSGIRIKILEALSLKSVIVCSTLDFNDCTFYKDMNNIVKYDTYEEFKHKILELEESSILYEKIKENGYNTAQEKLSWDEFKTKSNIVLKSFGNKK